jgi:ABC-2 type transport system ATP-binding protein
MLDAQGVVKGYGSVKALDGLDLTIARGEIVGLIGHNGAGKSTLVAILAGLVRADAGVVRIAGLAPRAARHLLGVAPQELALYFSATLRENLCLFGGLAGLRGRDLRLAIEETAEALALTDLLDRPVGLLSGGQQRRVQAATALVHRPELLLLDEPTVGADPATRRALLAVVRQRAAEGAAVCYTTHYLPELAELGATLAVVARGRVIARGGQDALLAHLPGMLRAVLANGQERVIRTPDPSSALAALLREGQALTSVDIERPSLDDLYHSLEAGLVAQ